MDVIHEFHVRDNALQIEAIEYNVFDTENDGDVMGYVKEIEPGIKDMFESPVLVAVDTSRRLTIIDTDDEGDDIVITVDPGNVIIKIEDGSDPDAYRIVIMPHDMFDVLYTDEKETSEDAESESQ